MENYFAPVVANSNTHRVYETSSETEFSGGRFVIVFSNVSEHIVVCQMKLETKVYLLPHRNCYIKVTCRHHKISLINP